jgi:hypothetical protein
MKAVNQVKKLPVKESDTLKLIKEYLKLKGFFVVRMQQNIGSHKGIPDLYFIGYDDSSNSIQGWCEVKTPKGKLSKHQEEFRDNVTYYGAYFIEAHSLDDVQSFIRDLGIKHW